MSGCFYLSIKYHILICLSEWILCWDYLFIQIDIKISLCINFTLFTLTALAVKIVYLVSFIISSLFKRYVGIGFRYVLSLLVLPITPDGPYLALNIPSTTRGCDSPETYVKGLSFPWHRFIIDFLREVAFPTDLGETRWSEKKGTKGILSSQRWNNNMDYHYSNNDFSSLSLLKFINGRQTFMNAPVSFQALGIDW